MKCISCEIEINPQWAHAIDINVCPFCGKHIMEEHLKNLFSTLRDTMLKLNEYPSQLNDWMLSNHQYIKTDSPDIGKYMPAEMIQEIKKAEEAKEFSRKKGTQDKELSTFNVTVPTENGGEEVVVAQKMKTEEQTSEFFKRAHDINPTKPTKQQAGPNVYQSPAEKTQHLKKVAQQIRKEGASVGGGGVSIPADMLENADPDAVAEYQQMITGGEVSSSIDSDIDDDLPGGEFILQANIAAASRGASSGGSGAYVNPKDLAHLQRLQAKVSESRRAVANGSGGKGSFSRS